MGSNIIEGSPGTRGYVPPEWKMPDVELGDIVFWSWNSESEKSSAIVTRVGTRTIAVSIIVDSMHDFVLRGGVRHVEDPHLQKNPQHDAGCWQHKPRHKRIEALLSNFEEESE